MVDEDKAPGKEEENTEGGEAEVEEKAEELEKQQ